MTDPSAETDPSGEAGSQPYSYEVDATAAGLAEKYAHLEAGTETGDTVSVAGRLMLRRVQGKLAFGTLADSSGRIQLFAPARTTPAFEEFCDLDLGDWVGVRGEVMATRRGELSVRVDEWVLLAHTRRTFPDKFHGLSDTDTRYRQRYVDLWVTEGRGGHSPCARGCSSLTRRFLEDRGYLEVGDPRVHPIPGGALATPFTSHHNALDADLFLRIAPELYLKRLVVGGFERVFEVARVFRNEGISNRHNPEFTMLECYEAYGDYEVHMALTEELVEHLAVELTGSAVITYQDREVDLSAPWRRATLAELTSERIGREVSVHTDPALLVSLCEEHRRRHRGGLGRQQAAARALRRPPSELWDPVFVTEYPAEVSRSSRATATTRRSWSASRGSWSGASSATASRSSPTPTSSGGASRTRPASATPVTARRWRSTARTTCALGTAFRRRLAWGSGIDRLVMLLADRPTIRDVVLFPPPPRGRGSGAGWPLSLPGSTSGVSRSRSRAARRSSTRSTCRCGQAASVAAGSSGCGKTTLLRVVAGLEGALGGRVVIGGRTVTDAATSVQVAPQDRRVAMVFQDWALLPHLDVARNITLGRSRRSAPTGDCSPMRWRWWACGASSTGGPTSSAVASSSVWRWPARWRSDRRCCCSTSRSPTSTPRCVRGFATRCANCSRTLAPPPCWSPTTGRRPFSWATRWP
ncbi:MAG: amino acid--tRNA ligase-related protein [Microthrixaceae bacterium]